MFQEMEDGVVGKSQFAEIELCREGLGEEFAKSSVLGDVNLVPGEVVVINLTVLKQSYEPDYSFF